MSTQPLLGSTARAVFTATAGGDVVEVPAKCTSEVAAGEDSSPKPAQDDAPSAGLPNTGAPGSLLAAVVGGAGLVAAGGVLIGRSKRVSDGDPA